MVAAGARTRLRYFACLGFVLALVASVLPATAWAGHQVAAHTCPSKLSRWQALVKAGWIDCHRLENLNVSSSNDSANPPNPYTDPNVFFGMGLPPEQGAGTLHSKYTHAEQTPVSGIQIDGWFADSCNAFVQEPALLNKAGQPFIPGCTPAPGGTCSSGCHHDGQFVIRIPDTWDGHLLTSGTPGVRDAFASDFILSDCAMERGWAYVSQDKGNIGTNFYRSGADETACKTPWCPAAAIQEWTLRVRQATRQAGKLLKATARSYGLSGVTRSYIAGISNGGYQTRRAIESDTKGDRLYDGGVDWEGTLFLDHVPPGGPLDSHHWLQPVHVPADGTGQLSRRRAGPAHRRAGFGPGRFQPAVTAAVGLSLVCLLGPDAEDLPIGVRPGVHQLHLLRPRRLLRVPCPGASAAHRSGRVLRLLGTPFSQSEPGNSDPVGLEYW